MNVLNLFDGISSGMVALERASIPVTKYYASEIDKYAIQISQKNYPNIIQLGDVTNWQQWDIDWSKIDLLIGGSPCQGFSRSGLGLNFEDPRSQLFFVFVDILNHIKKYNNSIKFLLENVVMKKEWADIITNYLGVNYIAINSNLVSAQNRNRLYWANFPITQPEDKEIFLRDVVFQDVYPFVLHNLYGGFNETKVRVFEDKSPTIRTAAGGGHIPSLVFKGNRKNGLIEKIDKALPLCSSDWRGINRNQNQNMVVNVEALVNSEEAIEYMGVASRGRFFEGKQQQMAELNGMGKANSITTVHKDSMLCNVDELIHSDKAIEYMNRTVKDGRNHWDFAHHSDIKDEKSATVVANFFKGIPYNVFKDWNCIRKFHPIECERLQTLPDNYTEGVSNTQRYKAIGNGWTIDVITHIFECMKKDMQK